MTASRMRRSAAQLVASLAVKAVVDVHFGLLYISSIPDHAQVRSLMYVLAASWLASSGSLPMANEVNARPAVAGDRLAAADLPNAHRGELQNLALDHASLDKTLRDHMSGAVVSDRTNTINLGVIRVAARGWTMTYRASEALMALHNETEVENAEWVTVNANTSLRHLLNEYGSRLIGYDAKRNEFTIEFLSWDLLDTSTKTVRILVRKA
jgi:hypothetical protein